MPVLMQSAQTYILTTSAMQLPLPVNTYLENTTVKATATYLDASGTAFVPVTVSYRVDDVATKQNIIPWTAIPTPALSNAVTIPSTANVLVDQTAKQETHQVLFQITDASTNVSYARVLFNLVSTIGTPGEEAT